MIGLNPLKPITLSKTRRHDLDSTVPDVLLQSAHASPLKIGYIVPTKVDATYILRDLILCDLTNSVRNDVITFNGWHSMGILLVVSWIIRVITRWKLDRLL